MGTEWVSKMFSWRASNPTPDPSRHLDQATPLSHRFCHLSSLSLPKTDLQVKRRDPEPSVHMLPHVRVFGEAPLPSAFFSCQLTPGPGELQEHKFNIWAQNSQDSLSLRALLRERRHLAGRSGGAGREGRKRDGLRAAHPPSVRV